MAIEDKVIIGSDLCNSECIERNNIIHPETCLGQVKLTDNNSESLYAWINNGARRNVEYYSSLKNWLIDNYPISGSGPLPIATTESIGCVSIDNTNLTINEEGVLGFNVESLPIEEHCSSYNNLGSIKLGNDTVISENFSNGAIPQDPSYKFPLRIDGNQRAGVVIPKSIISATQSDWNEINTSSASYILNKPQIVKSDWNEQDQTSNAFIKNKPVIPTVNDSVITFIQGNNIQTITLNQETNATIAIAESGIEGKGIVSISKTSSEGNVDTYTILYTDSTSSTFNVTNGIDGIDGKDGNDGNDGISITNIQKTGTSGLVDTYTILFSNGNTSSFTVTNGENGTSFTLKGSFNSTSELPSSGQELGDAYLINKHLWSYTGSSESGSINGFIDCGEIQGPAGDNSYTHVAYATTNTPSSQDIHFIWQNGDIYIGIYSDNNATASTDYTSYVWSKFVGDNGNTPIITISNNGTWIINGVDTQQQAIGRDGSDGSTGPQGVTGNSIFIRYSANADGSNMSSTYNKNSGHKYIGIYVGQEAPSTHTSYTWCKFIGDDGIDGTSSDINVIQSETYGGYKPLLFSNALFSDQSTTTCYDNHAIYDSSEQYMELRTDGQNDAVNAMRLSGNGIELYSTNTDFSSYTAIPNRIIMSSGLVPAPPSGQTSYLKYSNGFTWDTNPGGGSYTPVIDEIYYNSGTWADNAGNTSGISINTIQSLINDCSNQNNKFSIFLNIDANDNSAVIPNVASAILSSLNNNTRKHSVDLYINREFVETVSVITIGNEKVFETNRDEEHYNYYDHSSNTLHIAKNCGAKVTFARLNNNNTLWVTYFLRS